MSKTPTHKALTRTVPRPALSAEAVEAWSRAARRQALRERVRALIAARRTRRTRRTQGGS